MQSELLEATRLREAARVHMRAARRHRKRARELMRQLELLTAAAAARGIRIEINTQPIQGGPSGDQAGPQAGHDGR